MFYFPSPKGRKGYFLFADVRQKRHESRALDRLGEFALMLCADPRMARVNNLGLARNKPTQKVDLFVINVLDVLRAEETLLRQGM
jgi:hypothetical protein